MSISSPYKLSEFNIDAESVSELVCAELSLLLISVGRVPVLISGMQFSALSLV